MIGDPMNLRPTPSDSERLPGRELALLFLGALAVRLLALPAHVGDPAPVPGGSDAVGSLLAGVVRLLPEPTEVALRVGHLFGDPDPALVTVRLLLVLLGALAAPLVAAAAARMGGRVAGLVAGALLALSPFALGSSFTLGPAALLLLGGSAALAGLTRAARGEGGALATGAGAGLALAAGGGGGLGLLAAIPFAREDSPRRTAAWLVLALVSGAAVFAVLSPASIAGFPRLPGVATARPVDSPLLAAIGAVFLAAGPLAFGLAVIGKLDLMRRRTAGSWAVLVATGGAFLVPVLRHGSAVEPLAAALPGIFLLAGVAAAAPGLSVARRGAALVAVALALFGAGSFLVAGFVRRPTDAASEWIRRNVNASEVLLVEAGGPRLPSVEGVREARALTAEGALPPDRLARYAPAGKVFQPIPLPASGSIGLESALCYDPNLVQFFRWIVLSDPISDWREATELATARSIFREYFEQDWETAARFDPGLSRRPGVTVLHRRADFTELDRTRLGGLAGVLGTEEATALRTGSEAYLEWITSAGTAFRQVNDLIAAERFLDFATLLDSTRVEPRYQYALVELQRENLPMAKERLFGVLMLDTEHGGALYNLGTVLEAEGELEGAAIQYAAAIPRMDDPSPAHARLGALLVRFGRPEEAREQLEAIRRLAPDSEAERHLEAILGSP